MSGTSPSELVDADDISDSDDYVSAKKHCLRAKYDAVEGPILFFLKQLQDFQEDYKNEPISSVFPDYIEKITNAENIKKQLANISSASRQNYANVVEGYFDQLYEISSRLPFVREELNKKISVDEKNKRYVIYGILIALLGILIKL
ncbi:MAG: hypothetical protein HQL94_11870 [Magnetococcales bacterium]|nr:hypothetical protein [Magnetococcales bacterium]